MAPPAPGLLSTTTGTLICLLSASASSRMLMSLPPPAGQATIRVTGSEGNVCACTLGDVATIIPAAMPPAANVRRVLRLISRLRRRATRLLEYWRLSHEFPHDIEREQTVFVAAQESEDRLVDSRIDEVLQPSGAML